MGSKTALQDTAYLNQPPTPSLIKRKKIQEKCDIKSPTDNMVSPCTRKLLKKPIKAGKLAVPRFTEEDEENAPPQINKACPER